MALAGTVQRSKCVGTLTQRTREEATNHKAEIKDIGKSKLSLDRSINTMHKFLCMHNDVCMHVMCTIVTMHTICEAL